MEGDQNNKKEKHTPKGRKKIEMKRLDKKEDRTSTFSKRKFGIHKKSTEISTLCGAEVGFVAVSPSGNPCTFATSSIDTLTARFLSDAPPPPDSMDFTSDRVKELKKECDALEKFLAAEQHLSRTLEASIEAVQLPKSWIETPLDNLNYSQLAMMKKLAEESHRTISEHIGRRERVESAAAASSSGRGSVRYTSKRSPYY